MKHLLIFLVLVMGLMAPGAAQELPKFKKPLPPQAQILKMRYLGLNDWAYKNAVSIDEAQADYLAEWYAGIRKKANRKMLDDASLEAATKALNRWSSDRWQVFSMQAGGGTMWTHASIREVAVIADLETDAIKAWKAPGKAGAGNGIKSFKTLALKKTDVNSTPADEYQKALDDEAASLENLKVALRKLPPGPQAVYAKWMKQHADQRWR